ncbi:hypothetical protein [Legionella fallonii]|uniref:Lipoprotein n=1 Tax=Legionella fallonii LLAP-10 TaxID=1212491 RepID=A0A098GB63_9GAMM|nr:hypothetical protein [Legionella fallonii]CEG58711.1 exported protein of unknown function [Legionella fallonii LLAP-10]
MARSFLVIILAMGCTVAFGKNACSSLDDQAITQSVYNYVKNKTAVSSDNIITDSIRCVGSFSSAQVTPKDHSTDAATVYLHKDEDGQWVVMSLGTYFDQDFLSKIPKELR